MGEANAGGDGDGDGLTLVVIAAVAENGVIGDGGAIPWHYPADLQQFRHTTTGHPVIVGRRTYESIVDRLGEPLPDRTMVVLTESGLGAGVPEEVVVAGSVDAAVGAAAACERPGPAYVAGGASVYEQLLPLADRMVLTEVPARPAGDTHFPEWDSDRWVEVERRTEGELAFVTYERR